MEGMEQNSTWELFVFDELGSFSTILSLDLVFLERRRLFVCAAVFDLRGKMSLEMAEKRRAKFLSLNENLQLNLVNYFFYFLPITYILENNFIVTSWKF